MSRINIHFSVTENNVTTKYQTGPFGNKFVANAELAKIKQKPGVSDAKLTHLDYDDRVKA